jgi:oxygen-independent coproporphyrinogen-3 oxidase
MMPGTCEPMSSPPAISPALPRFGVYLHFPYCRQHCPYCDFAVAVRKQIPHDRYLRAIRAELLAKAPLFAGRRAVSLYLGGGTPSLWRPDCIAAVIAEVLAVFPSPPGCTPEITLECDPNGMEPAQLHALRQAGVNRLSIGAQSLQPRHLVQLGRQHVPEDVRTVVARARAAGFANLSLDLMIGLCGQQRSELDDDLQGVLALRPEHVSLYQLTIEPGTALAASIRRGHSTAPSDDEQADAYERVREVLGSAGYAHYEISSFARRPPPALAEATTPATADPDYRARHNRLYWTLGEYLGLGVSAHSFRRLPDGSGERFANQRGVESYLAVWATKDPGAGPVLHDAATAPGLAMHEHRDGPALAREALWLGLRALDGLSRREFVAQHGHDPVASYREAVATL